MMERVKIKQRLGQYCRCCGTAFGRLTIDHIIPKSKGGSNSENNLSILCLDCNTFKGSLEVSYEELKLMRVRLLLGITKPTRDVERRLLTKNRPFKRY